MTEFDDGPMIAVVSERLSTSEGPLLEPYTRATADLLLRRKLGEKRTASIIQEALQAIPPRSRPNGEVHRLIPLVDDVVRLAVGDIRKYSPFAETLGLDFVETIDRLLPTKYRPKRRRAADDAIAGERGAEVGEAGLSELGNAIRFTKAFGADFHYWVERGRWLHYDGIRYEVDEGFLAVQSATHLPDIIRAEAERSVDREQVRNWADRTESRAVISASLDLARSQPGIALFNADLDRDIYLLNATNGTIDLRTGELRPHRRDDRITRRVPVAFDRDARAPEWDRFLKQSLADDALITFVRRAIGYSATGDVSEQKLFVNHGTGGNGKTIFSEVLNTLFGDYSRVTPFSTFVAQDFGERIPNDIAMLAGSRFVCAKETRESRYLDEAVIKSLTGGDTQTARFLRHEFFSFPPTWKIWLFVNHLPFIEGSDYGIARRLRVIPWKVRWVDRDQAKPGDQVADPHLKEKLLAELPGILTHVVHGALEWQKHGLGTAAVIDQATEQYREEMDPVGEFLEDECLLGPEWRTNSTVLYSAHRAWRKQHGMDASISDKALAPRFKAHGLELVKSNGERLWKGVALLTTRGAKPTANIEREAW
ncbi:MAG: phage/plasmid primase, P4 family [Thermoplasmata archaeon]|nr:phage/plasmid primase, P4 family [Thermoplasmata archaeon]